ncbi:MAG: hypothetical protein WCN95_16270 [bacterium]
MALIMGVVLFTMNTQAAQQYILVNVMGGWKPDEVFSTVSKEFPTCATNHVRVGIGAIFSYLSQPRAKTVAELRQFLKLSQEYNLPVVVQFDGENWWSERPDLWNWWDPAKPGYNPANRANVEWTGWQPTNAIKIAWRNWGRQLRVQPPPNLMSPAFRKVCSEEMNVLVPIVLKWWRSLPKDKKDLFVGIKVGHESSIGVNAWYYPNGNDLLNKPEKDDPTTGLNHSHLPDRGVTAIGYAAVKTAGLCKSGDLTEADVAEVSHRHLDGICRELKKLGVPRDRLFTHGAGWKSGERLYHAAVNTSSCPGWSFYQYASDPSKDVGVQECLKNSDAPYFGAVEWLFMESTQTGPWCKALENTLAMPRCRFLCIYNWQGIMDNKEILSAIKTVSGVKEQP